MALLAAATLVLGGCPSSGDSAPSGRPDAALDAGRDVPPLTEAGLPGQRDASRDALPAEAARPDSQPPASARPESPIIFIAIDAFVPEYLKLDRNGDHGGVAGNWLTPKIREFLEQGTHFSDARDYLPSATDMNHLNALSGTNSGQTGIIGVSVQSYGWDSNTSEMQFLPPHTSWAYDGNGTKVETVFRLIKQKWPLAMTAMVSGKAWVSDMYRKDGSGFDSGLDLVVSTKLRPDYVPEVSAYKHSWFDPETDGDGLCDPESTASQALLAAFPQIKDPAVATPDRWTVDATLAVLERDQPDAAFILLAQTDDAQHLLGAAWNPDEFEGVRPPYLPPRDHNCVQNPLDPAWQRWQLVSKRNRSAFREPILDQMRDVDHQFGRLIESIGRIERYKNATIVLYSDHGQVTHLVDGSWGLSDAFTPPTDFFAVLQDAGVLSAAEVEGKGFDFLSGTSLGMLYFKDSAGKADKVARSIEALRAYKAENPETKVKECPWEVVGLEDMKNGLPGVTVPGELYHKYFDNRAGRYPIWPDIYLLLKNGWQVPVYKGRVGNLGITLPESMPPFAPLFGGHGSTDTQRILMALSGPGIAAGKVVGDSADYAKDFRIADLAVTVAELYGLTFPHKTVGKSRRADLQ